MVGGRDGYRADDVAGHQQLEPEQDGTSDPLPVTTVIFPTGPASQPRGENDGGNHDAYHNHCHVRQVDSRAHQLDDLRNVDVALLVRNHWLRHQPQLHRAVTAMMSSVKDRGLVRRKLRSRKVGQQPEQL